MLAYMARIQQASRCSTYRTIAEHTDWCKCTTSQGRQSIRSDIFYSYYTVDTDPNSQVMLRRRLQCFCGKLA